MNSAPQGAILVFMHVDPEAPCHASGPIAPCERTNAAVAIGAAMSRAVIAAHTYRETGALPAFATTTQEV